MDLQNGGVETTDVLYSDGWVRKRVVKFGKPVMAHIGPRFYAFTASEQMEERSSIAGNVGRVNI